MISMKNLSQKIITSKAVDKKKHMEVIFILTGFGLGDLFNFGFHVLPGVLQKYRCVHIITNHAENIFKYESRVIWHSSAHKQINALVDRVLEEYSDRISRVMYLDNHAEFLAVLKNITKKHGVQLSYPSRMLINKLVCMEKGFYFNIYIRMIHVLDSSILRIKKPIKLYGNNEKLTHRAYFIHHNIPRTRMNVVIIPESTKKVKSISSPDLLNIVEWSPIASKCNIFIVSRNPEYLLPGAYHLNSSTVSEICCFIDKSDVCISVDTGFIHVANFLKKNILGLFGPTSSKSSLYSQENVLEVSNLMQKKRCPFHGKIVYRSHCVRTDKCIHLDKGDHLHLAT
jgi:hypothetical protein